MYGKNRTSASAKGRWLARGIELLLYQYPGLRVAYMDNAGTFPELKQYAVLMRGSGAEPEGTNAFTEEVYRFVCWELPRLLVRSVAPDHVMCSRLQSLF